MKRLFAALAAIVTAVVLVVPAGADTPSESIAISPVDQHISAGVGETKTGTVTVINDGQVGYDARVYAQPYSVKGEQYEPTFTGQNGRADADTWLSFDHTSLHLDAGKSAEVTYTLHIPSAPAPGGHYAVIFAETQPAAGASGSVVVRKRVGSLVYVTVTNGQLTREGRVDQTHIDGWQQTLPLTAWIRIENIGNTDFAATTTMTVRDVFGSVKYQADRTVNILPATIRRVDMPWDKAPWFGLVSVKIHATYLDQNYDYQQLVLIAPLWSLVLLVFIVLLLVWWAVYAGTRRAKR